MRDLVPLKARAPRAGVPKSGVYEPLVVAYGGGVNSTAMIIGLVRRGTMPDAILFANTGGERPETYDFVRTFSEWVTAHGGPQITRLRTRFGPEVPYTTLEQECLAKGQLPSLAYGWHKCSAKWKVRAQAQWFAGWAPARACIEAGGLVRKAIGFHIDEAHRVKPHIVDAGVRKVYPLLEWGYDQAACVAEIEAAGLTKPPKSACFFCPASTKSQILALADSHPDLMRRALKLEEVALASGNLQTVKGLGRRFAWHDVVAAGRGQCAMPTAAEEVIPCDCIEDDEDADE